MGVLSFPFSFFLFLFFSGFSRQVFSIDFEPVLELALLSQAGFEFTKIYLILPPECWESRFAQPLPGISGDWQDDHTHYTWVQRLCRRDVSHGLCSEEWCVVLRPLHHTWPVSHNLLTLNHKMCHNEFFPSLRTVPNA